MGRENCSYHEENILDIKKQGMGFLNQKGC